MRAFLVIGPESTGTRLATRILIAGGCYGSDDHAQPFDAGDFGLLDPVVWRRSVPHREGPLNLRGLLDVIGDKRTVEAVVTVRDWRCTLRSAVDNRHAPSEATAEARLRSAYLAIFRQLDRYGIPYRLLVYESLILHPRAVQRDMLESLGLDSGAFVDIEQRDAARWQETRRGAA